MPVKHRLLLAQIPWAALLKLQSICLRHGLAVNTDSSIVKLSTTSKRISWNNHRVQVLLYRPAPARGIITTSAPSRKTCDLCSTQALSNMACSDLYS